MQSLIAAALTVALVAPLNASVQEQTEREGLDHYNLGKKALALGGYDPVAYFEVGGGKPTKGDKRITTTHDGVSYRFANEGNRELFLAAPDRFEPAYGGWCAYAMASGDKTDIDPKTFLVEDGRLLVFYNGLFGNTRKSWIKEGADELRPKADAGWQEFSGEEPDRALTHFALEQGLALGGVDPVSIATGAPLDGDPKIAAVHGGVTYHFATAENAATFRAAPQRFEPAYGGWCARAMAEGQQVAIDPRHYVVEEDRLLLFFSAGAREQWIEGRAALKPRADAAWAALI